MYSNTFLFEIDSVQKVYTFAKLVESNPYIYKLRHVHVEVS